MSTKMCLAVLRMDYEQAMLSELARWQYHKRGLEAADTIEAQAEHIRMLREALADAIICVQDWSAYVAPYYLEKHDLHGDVKRLRAALEASNDPAA